MYLTAALFHLKKRFLQLKLIPPSALLNKIWYNTKWDLSADNYALKCFSDYNCHHAYLYTAFNSECELLLNETNPPTTNIVKLVSYMSLSSSLHTHLELRRMWLIFVSTFCCDQSSRLLKGYLLLEKWCYGCACYFSVIWPIKCALSLHSLGSDWSKWQFENLH